MTARPGTPPRIPDGDCPTRPAWVGAELAPMELDWSDTPEPDAPELVWVGDYRSGAQVALAAAPRPPAPWWRRVLARLAQSTPGMRILVRRALSALLAAQLERRRLDLQLRCVGAPPARWWESRRGLEDRLWRAAVFGSVAPGRSTC